MKTSKVVVLFSLEIISGVREAGIPCAGSPGPSYWIKFMKDFSCDLYFLTELTGAAKMIPGSKQNINSPYRNTRNCSRVK